MRITLSRAGSLDLFGAGKDKNQLKKKIDV